MAEQLPIYEIEEQLVNKLRSCPRLILSAPTGSGKSTQVPQMLRKHGLLGTGQVVILQPRRLATRLLAARVAQEVGVALGDAVGYQIRFENVAGPATRIKYVTEGVLLRQMIQEPTLPGIQALIFDEFHERHLYGDITLARAIHLQESSRPDLLILVMSATLDSTLLEKYLHPCETVQSHGRMFPVHIQFASSSDWERDTPVWEQAAEAFGRYVSGGGAGDVLVFMPGSFEISQTLEAIRHRRESKDYLLLPLHGELQPRDQDAAVAVYRQPKVVVATNVAETSLTIEGIRLVIDSGLARIPRYDPYRGINTLLIEKISRASADQRAGRAGRTAPGECFRLWSEREHADRPAQELPEIRRLDLAEVVLTIKAAGITDLRAFRWLEAPDERSLRRAEDLLADLGAIDRNGEITPVGRRMLAFPAHPRYSRMLIAAGDYKCVYQACLIAALTQGRDLLLRNVDRRVQEFRGELFGDKAPSDFLILMRAYNYAMKNGFSMEACRRAGIHAVSARQVAPLLENFLRAAEREKLDVKLQPARDEAVQKCVLAGFSDHLARRLDEGTLRVEMVHGRRGVLVRDSVVQGSSLFVAAEVREIEGKDKELNTLLSLCTAVELDWLTELFPQDLAKEPHVYWDSTAKRVYAEQQLRFRDLVIGKQKIEPPPLEESSRLLAKEVQAGRLVLKEWDNTIDQWILRLNLLAEICPELLLPPMNEDDRLHIIEQICHGAFTYKEIKDRAVRPVVRSWLSASQADLLDKHAPERLSLPNGKTPKIVYNEDGAPYIAVRIQELFGVTATPRIAMNRLPVLVHVLAPNMRPVQITQDLAGFWSEHYPRIKQEMQRKYPKHEWR